MENTDKLNIATKTKLGVAQLKNTVTINSDFQITKVLTASVRTKVENIIPSSGEVKFDGSIEYDLLVVLDNNEITPITEKSTFSLVFEGNDISPDSVIQIESHVVELNSSNFASGDFSYNSTIDFDIYTINQNTDLECAIPPEDVFVREGEVPYTSLVCNTAFEASINFELPKDSKINKILYIKNYATIKSVIPSVDYFVVAGEVYSTIVYSTDDGVIKSLNKENSFSEEIEAKGTNKDSNIQAFVSTNEPIITENDEGNRFIFEIPICINSFVFNREIKSCVIDAYSIKYEVNLTTTSFEQNDFNSTKQVEENILTNFSLSETLSPIDKILAVIPTNIRLVNQIVKQGEILIDGIATLNIIYYSEDEEGNNILNSVDVDVPYSLTFNAPEVNEGDNVLINVSFGDINVKSRHGRELEILAEVKINYNNTVSSISYITTEISLGDEKEIRDCGLEIYLAKSSQTLWDIAKELNVSVTDIMSQNSELSLPLNDGEKIVVYRQLHTDEN